MNFFMNEGFNAQNSGIEHAQLKRALLFRKNQVPFKLVFRQWNPMIHHHLHVAGMHDNEILSLFDYFQHATNVKNHKITPRDIDFGIRGQLRYHKDPKANRYLVFKGNILLGRINYFGSDVTDHKQVQSVELFDGFGNLYRVDFFDLRGFKSMVQWYTPDNKIGTEVWYTPEGRPAIEDFYRKNAVGKMKKSGWKVRDLDGTVHNLTSGGELIRLFLNDINDRYINAKTPNIFIMDRSDVYEEELLYLRNPCYKILHLHNCQAGDATKPNTSILNNNYEYSLVNANQYDAIISATHKQTRDVIHRFHPQVDMFTIPVGVIPDKHFDEKPIPMKDRKQGNIVVTARIAADKRFDDVIRAMGLAMKKNPKLHLSIDLYGYVDHSNHDAAKKHIQKAMKEFPNTKGRVHLHGYTNNVAKYQKQGQVYPLASMMEGFNLAMMEAQSQGDVGVTYDCNYGPNELVVNNKNGYIVPMGGWKQMADRFVKLFSNPKLLQKMSDNAYKLSKRYSETNVWKGWKHLLDTAKKEWPAKYKLYRPDISQGLSTPQKLEAKEKRLAKKSKAKA